MLLLRKNEQLTTKINHMDINLSKQQLGSQLKQWGILLTKIRFYYFRKRNESLSVYFDMMDGDCFWKDIRGLFQEMNENYDPGDCRIYIIDSSKCSFALQWKKTNGNYNSCIVL